MILAPATLEELKESLREASAQRQKVEGIDLSRMNQLVEYSPEDMVVTVHPGLTLKQLQEQLAAQRQWLPLDPPAPEKTLIADLIAFNKSGPRRFGYRPVREHLIGLAAVLGDGRLMRSGGKVVKNVAGYDVMKLFVGARHSLGVVAEATFKLRPLPEMEQFLEKEVGSLAEAAIELDRLFATSLPFVVMDFHNVAADAFKSGLPGPLKLVVGLDGAREDVEKTVQQVLNLGYHQIDALGYEDIFWRGLGEVNAISVAPSRLTPAIEELREKIWVCRAGNGLIYSRTKKKSETRSGTETLSRRLKAAFDPYFVLPDFS
jgi:FAD/FMN-containing dehydrogenase